MNKALGETQTLHAGCIWRSQLFGSALLQLLLAPFLGAQDDQNLIS